MTELPAADRFSDTGTDNPYWNENSWFCVSIPERRIRGLIEHFFRPNMNFLAGGPVLRDPSGTWQWNCLGCNWSHLQAIPDGAEKFATTAPNSLAVNVVEPLRRYKITIRRASSWTSSGKRSGRSTCSTPAPPSRRRPPPSLTNTPGG
jgi:hypothetical protein